jgi:dipeptidyl-peptidase-3
MPVSRTVLAAALLLMSACQTPSAPEPPLHMPPTKPAAKAHAAQERKFLLERVDDVAVVQVYADGFERLPVRDKLLAWHLYQPPSRDVRSTCSNAAPKASTCATSARRSSRTPAVSSEDARGRAPLHEALLGEQLALQQRHRAQEPAAEHAERAGDRGGAGAEERRQLPLREKESARDLVVRLSPILFDAEFKPMVTAKNPEGGLDIVQASAATFYGDGVRMRDLEGFQEQFELNSTVTKNASGELVEEPWRCGSPEEGIPPGRFAQEIGEIVKHLEAALPFASDATRKALEAQIRFYKTGKREDRVAYDVAWVQDKDSAVDTVNSFVEVYVDPRGKKGSWEGIVSYEDPKKAALIKSLATNAQWFEDHMPYADAFKKKEVKGISARSIDVVIETGDSGP